MRTVPLLPAPTSAAVPVCVATSHGLSDLDRPTRREGFGLEQQRACGYLSLLFLLDMLVIIAPIFIFEFLLLLTFIGLFDGVLSRPSFNSFGIDSEFLRHVHVCLQATRREDLYKERNFRKRVSQERMIHRPPIISLLTSAPANGSSGVAVALCLVLTESITPYRTASFTAESPTAQPKYVQ